ncbi:MAG TPA: hypothetical protein VFQ79_14360 [Bryobacteraceae bacterium]|nr:hypothetical protein [Bryobacteraceae bacterium]
MMNAFRSMLRILPRLALLPAALALGGSTDSATLAWYMRETAMTADGRLTFLSKSWWPKAQALAEGQSFTMDLNRDGRPDTIVKRENGHIVQAIDDSGRTTEIWNEVSTAYLVSYKGTGLVDRMIVYIDNDGDGKTDEMEMRHYRDGYLRYAWFGENYDDDGVRIFDIKDWSYVGNNGKSKFRGNLQIYLNKYDPLTKQWLPLSECPFAFWDDNKDGHGDTVFRVSAAPLASLTGPDTDYANNYNYMWAEKATPLAEMGNLNVRLSFNIDPGTRNDPLDKPHYNFGFTMVGSEPYKYPNMTYTNPKRRPPQTVTRIDWKDGIAIGMSYPARETGFTWDESRSVWRWEGQFWLYERIYLSNTGGPTARWNMRREYSPAPVAERRLYYSDADKRYHLFGATEGWLEAGHLVNKKKDLEFRWSDRDGNGYLDTVQVFEGDNAIPSRTSHYKPRAAMMKLDREALAREYNGRILPQAIQENLDLIASLKRIANSPAAEGYEAEAAKAEMLERKRYCLDIARELYFLRARQLLREKSAAGPYPSAPPDRKKWRSTEPGSRDTGYSMGDTLRFWKIERQIAAFETSYAAGRLKEAREHLEQIENELK